MAPFRVVARHPSTDHHDHAWAQLAGPFDYLEDAEGLAQGGHADALTAAPESLAPEAPIRPDLLRTVGEAVGLGYETKVQELVISKVDDSGEPIEHRWKDVK